MSKPIQIYVDADACPVKNEVYRVAERHGLKVFVVSNSFINVPRDPMIERVVGQDALVRFHRLLGGWPIALILALYRQLFPLDVEAKQLGWKINVASKMRRLRTQTLGIVGLGRIGTAGERGHRVVSAAVRPTQLLMLAQRGA